MRQFGNKTSMFFPATILFVAYVAAGAACRYGQEEAARQAGSVTRSGGLFIQTIWVDSVKGSVSENFLAIVIYFENLGCMPCLNSLRELSESLQRNQTRPEYKNVMLLVARTQDTYALQRRKLEAWCAANDLRFPLYLIPSDSLKHDLIGRTSAVLVDSTGQVELCEPFPLSPEVSEHILRRMAN